jgi:polysaccharide pyruvyl transferase WcaK-like protein
MLHVGDEAMFEAMVIELRSRGATTITALSSNPVDTTARYGIDAIRGIGFRGLDRAAMVARMAAVLDDSIAVDDPARAVRAAVASSNLVVIAGGGNMTSIWPSHIFERATLAAIAQQSGVPVVISGQTLGPELSAGDATVLSELLDSSSLVSTREAASRRLAHVLGTTATLTPDDASFLADLTESSAALPAQQYCLVTLSTHTATTDRAEFVAAVARLLDHIATTTSLGIVFSGHFAPLDGDPRGDEVVHELVRAAMDCPSDVARVTTAAHSAALARGAALVVSSRYHPVVFAVSAGVPAIGIPVDDYTTIKLTGALGNFGQKAVLPIGALLAGDGADLVDDVWQHSGSLRADGIARASEQRVVASDWWDSVARTAHVT